MLRSRAREERRLAQVTPYRWVVRWTGSRGVEVEVGRGNGRREGRRSGSMGSRSVPRIDDRSPRVLVDVCQCPGIQRCGHLQ